MADKDTLAKKILEEMLRKGEIELFPKMERAAGRFIDLFNHDQIQERIQQKLDEIKGVIDNIDRMVDKITDSRTVFDILKNLKELLEEVKSKLDLSVMFEHLFKNGFQVLLNDDKFKFLNDDTLDSDTRLKSFLELLDREFVSENESECTTEAFESYIATWKSNKAKLSRQVDENTLRRQEEEMRKEFETARNVNNEFVQTIISDIEKQFEPLRDKLCQVVDGINLGIGSSVLGLGLAAAVAGVAINPVAIGLISGFFFASKGGSLNVPALVTRGSDLFGAKQDDHDSGEKNRVRQMVDRNPVWFDKVKQCILKYLKGQVSDPNLQSFLRYERLEDDFQHFQDSIQAWSREFRRLDFKKYVTHTMKIDKNLFMKEVYRWSKLLYAVVLNDPKYLDEHKELLMEMVEDAGKITGDQTTSSLLPWIAFGQFPLSTGSKIQLKFVLDSSLSSAAMRNAVKEVTKMFEDVGNLKEHGNTITFEISVKENMPSLIARAVSRLADLSIRGVLIGNFGLGGFRHAMNPMYNRIYSLNAVELASGFIPTTYRGSLNRGGEPYFCPNGWRRYAIDVGMNGAEFERAYGDWHVAYHGTEGHLAMTILSTGIMASGQGCFLNEVGKEKGAVYLSPSIEYSGHPRYSRVWKIKTKYVQMVLQVRVNPTRLFDKRHGTLPEATSEDSSMDPNFKTNDELEWVVRWPPHKMITTNTGILVYGLMFRVTDEHPGKLEKNKWWEASRPGCWEYF